MFVSLVLSLSLAVQLVFGGYPSVIETKGRPWPLPVSETPGTGSIEIEESTFAFVGTGVDCLILQNAYARYHDIIFGSSNGSFEYNSIKGLGKVAVSTVPVDVQTPCETYPHLDIDESYLVNICPPENPTGAEIVSNTVWGALRGLETFSQLAVKITDSTFYLNCTQIFDYPRFSHRGIMLDTSRHFLPISIIKENLDIMAMNKFNVFHWHLVDDQSFPYESGYNPSLSAMGSYSSNLVYTASDVDSVIEYARQRGIRVVSEFDTPGHVKSWGPGQPGLLTDCYSNGQPDGSVGPIDPSNEANYVFLEGHFSEVSSRFPDHYIHLGGDEVPFSCWQSNPNITDFMSNLGITGDYVALESYYITRLVEIINNLPNANGYIVWEEVFDNGVVIASDTVVHVWKYEDNPSLYYPEIDRVTAAGYRALLSSCWYLNYISYGIDWHKYYECDPQGFGGTSNQQQLVMGGEACIWGEYVDETNLISRLWPRASAVAERLWSDKDATTSANAAESRLSEHRCRLLRRGYAVEPINGPSYCVW